LTQRAIRAQAVALALEPGGEERAVAADGGSARAAAVGAPREPPEGSRTHRARFGVVRRGGAFLSFFVPFVLFVLFVLFWVPNEF
jgi:hypothetical protein